MTDCAAGEHKHNPPGLPNFPFTGFFKLSKIISTGLLATNWVYSLNTIKHLAENIPMQYSFNGAVNWTGNKYLLFLLPIGATIAYFSYLFKKTSPERELFPLSTNQNNGRKVEFVALTLRSLLSIITQAAALAGAYLVVRGPKVTQATRATWIRTGLAVGGALFALSYVEANYLLNRKSKH